MGKYAVLVGINYHKNPEAALKGCVNDTYLTKAILLSKGFAEGDIIMINDEDQGVQAPTGVNVKKALAWLCSERTADDVLVFHYSGHGTQIPADGDDAEADNKDEAIVLEGMFLLADDDIKQFFSEIPSGCQATFISDCCHSGGMLDHAAVIIDGDKRHDAAEASHEAAEAADSEARSLPIATVANILSAQLGKPVKPTASGVNGGLASIFGGDAGKLAMAFAASQIGGGKCFQGDPLSVLVGAFGGGSSGGNGGGGGGAAAVIGALGSMMTGGGGDGGAANPLAAALSNLGLSGSQSATASGAPPYTPTLGKMAEDKGVLLTGCQSNQTSADVRPKNGKPHGALTKAIKTAYDAKPDATYRELTLAVRKHLHKGGFSQNPQLECDPAWADTPFICGGGKASGASSTPGVTGNAGERTVPNDNEEAPTAEVVAPLMKMFKACFK